MSSRTKIERNAINKVRDFIDATICLRSYLEANDKTPMWDGSIFVYEKEPDKNENFIGAVKSQVKGTEVNEFQAQESFRIMRNDLDKYMREGGLYYFVVEILNGKPEEKKIFYKELTPDHIRVLLENNTKSQSIEITLNPIPTDFCLFEDEMVNFIHDARKQTSFVDCPALLLSDIVKPNTSYKLRGDVLVNTKGKSLSMALTSQPFCLYKEEPYANIPVHGVVAHPIVTEHIEAPVSVNGHAFYSKYIRRFDLKTVTVNIGDVFIVKSPKKGYENLMSTKVEIKYPQKGGIEEALNSIDFLYALSHSDSIVLGENVFNLCFLDADRQLLFKDVAYMHELYHDMDALWHAMQIPGRFSFDMFDEVGLQQYLNVVLYVYRGVEGQPINAEDGVEQFYSLINAGPLRLFVHHTHTHDNQYKSVDAFSLPYYTDEKGRQYPLLSAILANNQDIVFDNIHYDEQLHCYKNCMESSPSFSKIIDHDLTILQRQKELIKEHYKAIAFNKFLDALQEISKGYKN